MAMGSFATIALRRGRTPPHYRFGESPGRGSAVVIIGIQLRRLMMSRILQTIVRYDGTSTAHRRKDAKTKR